MTNPTVPPREQFRSEFDAIADRTFHLRLNAVEAWAVLTQLQLVLRYPKNRGPIARLARTAANRLELQVAVTPALAQVAAEGWKTRRALGPKAGGQADPSSPKAPSSPAKAPSPSANLGPTAALEELANSPNSTGGPND